MGQSIPNLPMVDRVWHVADLLDRMIEHAEVCGAAGRLDGGEALLRAAARCMECAETARCARFLASANSGDDIPPFCPNADFLRRCRELRRNGREAMSARPLA